MATSLIYEPAGRAHEYSPWACNLYRGCSNLCSYCYNRKGVMSSMLGGDTPVLKKNASLAQFKVELYKYKDQILAAGKGLFFNFVSDPCLKETVQLNWNCILHAVKNSVPCVILTKRADFLDVPVVKEVMEKYPSMITIGFSLTGHDNEEPGASPTDERIASMKEIHDQGVKTFSSLEPVISISGSRSMIQKTLGFCDHYKIGLLNGAKRSYTAEDVITFYNEVNNLGLDVYWKDSVIEVLNKG